VLLHPIGQTKKVIWFERGFNNDNHSKAVMSLHIDDALVKAEEVLTEQHPDGTWEAVDRVRSQIYKDHDHIIFIRKETCS